MYQLFALFLFIFAGSCNLIAHPDSCIRFYESKQRGLFSDPEPWVNDLSWNPKNSEILATTGFQTVKLWDMEKRGRIDEFVHHISDDGGGCFYCMESSPADAIVWNDTGEYLASGGNKYFKVRDVQQGEFVREGEFSANVVKIAYSSDGNMIAVGLDNGVLHVFDIRDRKVPAIFTGYVQESEMVINDISFSPDNNELAIAADGALYRLDLKHGEVQENNDFDGMKGIKSVVWNSSRLLVAAKNGVRAKEGDETRTFVRPHRTRASRKEPRIVAQYEDRVAIAYNEQMSPVYDSFIALVNAKKNGVDSIVETKKLRVEESFEEQICWVRGMEFNATGQKLAVSDSKGRINVLPVGRAYERVDKETRLDYDELSERYGREEADGVFETGHRPFAYSFSAPSDSRREMIIKRMLRRTKSSLS